MNSRPHRPRSPAPSAGPAASLERLPAVPANGVFLLDYLAAVLAPLSRRAAKSLLDDRVVFVNSRRIWMAKHRLQLRDTVEVPRAALRALRTRDLPPPPIPILWQDGALLVADKPPALLTTGPRSLETRLRAQLRDPALTAVHRLDKDTSGCVLFAKTPDVRAALVALFEQSAVSKVYRVICAGRLPEPVLDVSRALDHLPAVSHFRTLSTSTRPPCSHLAAAIETGRTHQIRLHLQQLGCPVLGDRQHFSAESAAYRGIPRQMLHAYSLRFPHPLDPSRTVAATSPLPRDFLTALRALHLS